MSERKVLTKYYPPDFDPSLVGRARKSKTSQAGPKVQTVRLMAPFSLRCVACGEYMYRGRKFNARKETPVGEKYLGIQLYRFYIRCTRCSAEIVFRTDPKNQDYVVERGAKRNTEPWKRGLEGEMEETDEQRLERLEREMAEAEGEVERNAMAELEAKTEDAKREMAVADALDEIRSRNARLEKAQREGDGLLEVGVGLVTKEEEERRRQEEEDAEAARRAFAFARRQEALEEIVEEDGETGDGVLKGDGAGSGSSSAAASTSDSKPASAATTPDIAPPPSFKRVVKKKKDHAALLGIKKKQPLV
ncbi:CWC16 protein [Chaetomium strumarium]|uniref:Splicing factor YJU2 n=1 Tax=Chaetomium strumarium TaxID=1170767 RepID=A0AAJ0GZ45_9PEZI|nr:CWC16 protein [Chaetomium strumarium]